MNLSSKNKYYFLLLIGGVIILTGYFLKPAVVGASSEPVGKVVRETLLQRVTIAGAAVPARTTIVAAPYDGYVKKIFVKLGDGVKAGDPLVSIVQSLQAVDNVFPIRAPFSGTVTQVMKGEGQFAKQNDPKEFILRIDDMHKMYIEANAPEIDVLKLKAGLEAVVKVAAVVSKNYKGLIKEISQAAIPKEQWGGRSQVEYLVKIEITDADEMLKPGMTAVVDIITHKKENVLTLAYEFVQKNEDQYFVILKDGHKKLIKVGLQNESAFEITDGLTEGQQVLQIDFLKLIEKQ